MAVAEGMLFYCLSKYEIFNRILVLPKETSHWVETIKEHKVQQTGSNPVSQLRKMLKVRNDSCTEECCETAQISAGVQDKHRPMKEKKYHTMLGQYCKIQLEAKLPPPPKGALSTSTCSFSGPQKELHK